MTSPHAMDLTTEEPRPMDATLAGYAWLPRMIDKARAARAGTLGDYYRYPCPIDRACLDRLGIDAETFADIAEHQSSDTGIVKAMQKARARDPEQASFDPIRLNEELHSDGS